MIRQPLLDDVQPVENWYQIHCGVRQVVANNVQTAALRRSLRTERRYDDVTFGFNRTRYFDWG